MTVQVAYFLYWSIKLTFDDLCSFYCLSNWFYDYSTLYLVIIIKNEKGQVQILVQISLLS